MEVKNHLLYEDGVPVAYKQTPNLSAGVKTPVFVVAHFDAASNSTSAVNWLTQKGSNVSADLHIAKSGKITQMAKFNTKTWHAGASEYKGYKQLNQNSIGIEIENRGKVNGAYEDYQEIQIQKFIEISKALVKAYPTIKEIVGHESIAVPRGRKDDPGPKFPMERVNREVFGSQVTSGNVVTKKVVASKLNIRSGPSVNYDILGTVSKGDEVHVVSESSGWTEIISCDKKIRGWVSNQYLR